MHNCAPGVFPRGPGTPQESSRRPRRSEPGPPGANNGVPRSKMRTPDDCSKTILGTKSRAQAVRQRGNMKFDERAPRLAPAVSRSTSGLTKSSPNRPKSTRWAQNVRLKISYSTFRGALERLGALNSTVGGPEAPFVDPARPHRTPLNRPTPCE